MPQNVSQPDTYAVGDHDEESAIPITSRFLFVDVAAQRAKQLRRGAVARLDRHAGGHTPHQLERVAMEEVRMGLINYSLPTRADVPVKP
jgi:DNA-directed RNA polymerase subunit K/omega